MITFRLLILAVSFFLALPALASDFSPRAAELARARHEKTSDAGKRYLTVKTNAPHNREVKFFYHVPAGYDPAAGHKYRVLVYFGGRNCSGEAEAGDKLGFAAWGDAHGVFIVGPGFRDDNYWRPEGRSLVGGGGTQNAGGKSPPAFSFASGHRANRAQALLRMA